jgi:hypothetical protein
MNPTGEAFGAINCSVNLPLDKTVDRYDHRSQIYKNKTVKFDAR